MEIGLKATTLSWKYKILASVVLGILYVGILYLIDYWTSEKLQGFYYYLFQGIFFGLIMGIGFPYLMQKFATTSKVLKNITPSLLEDEEIEIHGPANLFVGREGVGGKMFLTNTRLVFKPHKFNLQRGQKNIDYKNIQEISARKTGKLIDNGIRIHTKDDEEYDFVVNERSVWLEKLSERIVL